MQMKLPHTKPHHVFQPAQAGFVKRSGAQFEAMVRQREAANPRFGFLLPWSKHHPAYRAALAEALGSEEAAAQLLSESMALVAASKQKEKEAAEAAAAIAQERLRAAAAAAAAAPATAAAVGGPGAGGEVEEEAKPVMHGPAPQPLLLKANPTILKKPVKKGSAASAQEPAAGNAAAAGAAPEGREGAGAGIAGNGEQQPQEAGAHVQRSACSTSSGDQGTSSSGGGRSDTAGNVQGEAGETEAQQEQPAPGTLEYKFMQRRLRAKQLLAQKVLGEVQGMGVEFSGMRCIRWQLLL